VKCEKPALLSTTTAWDTHDARDMTTTSTPDLSSLTLRGDDYDPYQTSPAIIPGQNSYNPFNIQQQPKTPSRTGLPNVSTLQAFICPC